MSKWYFEFSSPWEHNWLELSVIRSPRDWVLCNRKIVMKTDFCASSPQSCCNHCIVFSFYFLLNALHIEYSLVKLRAWWSQPDAGKPKIYFLLKSQVSADNFSQLTADVMEGNKYRNISSLSCWESKPILLRKILAPRKTKSCFLYLSTSAALWLKWKTDMIDIGPSIFCHFLL